MFAPPANRSRALFTLTVRDDDRVDLWCCGRGLRDVLRARPGRGRAPARASGTDDAAGRGDRRARRPARRADGRRRGRHATEQARRDWNGRDFYVTIGDRSWEDAERYGFVSAGGGDDLHEAAREALPRRTGLPLQAASRQGLRRRRDRQGEGATGDRVRGRGRRAGVPILEAPLAEPEKVTHDADNPSSASTSSASSGLRHDRSRRRSGSRACSRTRSRPASCATARRSSTSSRRSGSVLPQHV